jgi:required for meiotic nuclear division protein 1
MTGSRIQLRAILLGLRIDTRGVEHPDTMALSPLTLRVGARGTAFVFRYGVAVFCDTAADEERAVIETLRPNTVEPLAQPEIDEVTALVRPEEEDRLDPGGTILLKDGAIERLQIVADVLSKSLVLAHHEAQLALTFDRIDRLAIEIKRRGQGGRRVRELVRQVGDVLLTQHRMVGRVAAGDKPDLLWDRPDLERLYARLADEYELPERGEAVDRKLALVGDTTRTVLELVQDQRTVRLELYIIGLIAIEILLSVYELFGRGH